MYTQITNFIKIFASFLKKSQKILSKFPYYGHVWMWGQNFQQDTILGKNTLEIFYFPN